MRLVLAACGVSAFALCLPLQASQSVKPTQPASSSIIAVPARIPTRNFLVFYYDDKFLIGGQHYGDGRDFAGPTEPALLVHSKAHDRWMQITAISTVGAKLGHSTPEMLISVSWDFTPYASRPYIEQPLKTPGSLMFPDRIEFEESTGRYALRHATRTGVPAAETVLYIRRSDLVDAFSRVTIPPT